MTRKLVSAALALALAGCGGGQPAPEAGDESPAPEPVASTPAPTAAPTATADPVEYVALGEEPFWRVETHDGRMTYSAPEKLEGVELKADESVVAGWTRFAGTMDGAPLVLEVKRAKCFDSMSGFAFSHQARLTRSDGIWNGCARLASEPQPRQ